MGEGPQHVRGVRFGVFELDFSSGELRKQGLKIKLQDQPFQVISILLEHAGEVVTREELRGKLWPEDTFVDFEHSLATAINKIREALGDTAQSPRFVETLPRRGYRFIAPVEPLGARLSANRAGSPEPAAPEALDRSRAQQAAEKEADPVASRESRSAPGPRRRLRIFGGAAGALLVALGILVAFNVAGLRERLMRFTGLRPAMASPKIGSIAVLPLANVSGDPKEDYFADGMTDELIATLGEIHSLRIISRTSVQQFKRTDKTVPEIARELHVDAILEGTVMHAGGRVRITAELVSADDRQLWSDNFESEESNALLLQDEMAREIADSVKIQLQPGEQARLAGAGAGAIDPAAQDAYLEGLFYYYKETSGDLPTAIHYLERAVQLDPNYAEAYALLAACYYDNSQSRWGNVPNAVAAQQAKTTALKALALNGSLAEPHVVLGAVAEGQEWDWAAAGNEFRRAIELDPNLVTAHVGYAWHLAYVGHPNEAVHQVNRAAELDPVSSYALAHRAEILFRTRHYNQAIEQARKAIELFPEDPEFYSTLGLAYQQKGMYAEAMEAWQTELKLQGEKPVIVAALENSFKKGGIRGVWRWRLNRYGAKRWAGSQGYGYAMAAYYSLLGEKDRALDLLERLYAERGQDVALAKIDPCFDNLRSDPRFRALMARLNFPQ